MLPDTGTVQRVLSRSDSLSLLVPRTLASDGEVVLGMCTGLAGHALYVFKAKLTAGVFVSLHCTVVNASDGSSVNETVDGSPAAGFDQAVMVEWQGCQYALMATDLPSSGSMHLYKRNGGSWSQVSLPGALDHPIGRAMVPFVVSGTEYLYILCDDLTGGNRRGRVLRYDGTTVTVARTLVTKSAMRSALVTSDGLLYLFSDYSAGTGLADSVTSLGLLNSAGTYNDSYSVNILHRKGFALGMRVFDGSIFVAHADTTGANGKLYRSSDRLSALQAFEYVADIGAVIPVSGSAPDCQMAVA